MHVKPFINYFKLYIKAPLSKLEYTKKKVKSQ